MKHKLNHWTTINFGHWKDAFCQCHLFFFRPWELSLVASKNSSDQDRAIVWKRLPFIVVGCGALSLDEGHTWICAAPVCVDLRHPKLLDDCVGWDSLRRKGTAQKGIACRTVPEVVRDLQDFQRFAVEFCGWEGHKLLRISVLRNMPSLNTIPLPSSECERAYSRSVSPLPPSSSIPNMWSQNPEEIEGQPLHCGCSKETKRS